MTDSESGRTLAGTLEIHTLELGRYNLQASDLGDASLLQQWLYWLLHAHEDKTMYDAREKAIRDRQWALNASFREGVIEGEIKGKIELIQTLQEILEEAIFEPSDLEGKSLDELQAITVELRTRIAKGG